MMPSNASKSSSDMSTIDSFDDEASVGERAAPPGRNDVEIAMTRSFKSGYNARNVRSSPPVAVMYSAMAEQPSNPSRGMESRNAAPRDSKNNQNKQPFFCGFLSLKHGCVLCCRFCVLLAIVGLSMGAGILIGKSMHNDDGMLAASDASESAVTTVESARDTTTVAPSSGESNGMMAPPKPDEDPDIVTTASPTTSPTMMPSFAPSVGVPTANPSADLIPVGDGMLPLQESTPSPSWSFSFPVDTMEQTAPLEDLNDCEDGSNYFYRPSEPTNAMDLGHYGGSASCRFDYVTCEPTSWSMFGTHTGTATHWFKATASENSVCEANVEHRIKLTVPAGVDYDLHIYKHTEWSLGSAMVPVFQSSTNAAGVDEEVVVSSEDLLLVNDCFEYYIMVEYRSGSSCAPWTVDVFGHDCY